MQICWFLILLFKPQLSFLFGQPHFFRTKASVLVGIRSWLLAGVGRSFWLTIWKQIEYECFTAESVDVGKP